MIALSTIELKGFQALHWMHVEALFQELSLRDNAFGPLDFPLRHNSTIFTFKTPIKYVFPKMHPSVYY